MGVFAQDQAERTADVVAQPGTPASAPPPTLATQPKPPIDPRSFDGAFGLVLRHGAAYAGGLQRISELAPGGYVRWGRLSLVGRGGFAIRSKEELSSGAEYELVRTDQLRSSVSLRLASGRDEGKTAELRGMGDIDGTVRLRLGASYALTRRWSLRGGLSPDVRGKGLGTLLDVGLGRSWNLSDTRRLDFGLGVSAGDKRYMRAWHGVTPAQAAGSSYATFRPGAGVKDMRISMTLREELGRDGGGFFGGRWSAYVRGSVGRLLGEAANSPLTLQAGNWQLTGGLAKRF